MPSLPSASVSTWGARVRSYGMHSRKVLLGSDDDSWDDNHSTELHGFSMPVYDADPLPAQCSHLSSRRVHQRALLLDEDDNACRIDDAKLLRDFHVPTSIDYALPTRGTQMPVEGLH